MSTVLIGLSCFVLGTWVGWRNCKNHLDDSHSWKNTEVKLLKNALHEITRKTGKKVSDEVSAR